MSAVDFFGRTVNRNYRRHPRFTRGFLRFGYAAQQILLRQRRHDLRLPSEVFLEQMSMRAMRRPLADPASAALVNMFVPAELFHSMGLHPLCAEGFSSYLSGGKCERGYLDFASERGVPETFCSYHKALLGAVYAGLIPKPRFIVTTSAVCDANTSTFRRAAAHYGMDEFFIDVPYDETKESVRYLRSQLEDLVAYLEEGMSKSMDKSALIKAVKNSNETLRYKQLFTKELTSRSFPNYIAAEMHRILAGHNLLGTDEALAFFRMQYTDILRCEALNRVNSPKRILWCHVLPYYVEPLKKVFNFSDRVQLLMSDLNFDTDMEIDEDDILGSMARRMIRNHFNGDSSRRAKSVTAMAHKLGADGAVIFCHWGCKHSNGGAYLLRDELKEIGVHTIIIDGDACDRRNTNEGQIATRLQAFLEILEGDSHA